MTTLGFLTLFLVAGLIATVPAESTEHEEDNIPIATLIDLSFDDTGIADSVFADSSTLESTVDALELIQLLKLKHTASIGRMYDKLTDHILSLQDSGGGFRVSNDSVRPDIKTTALSLKALNLMGRLDTETRAKAHFYLGNYFSSGLNFDEWLTNGVFEPKYWGLVAAKELGGVGVIDMDELSLANVHLLQSNDASGVVLLWDDVYFKSNSSDPFNDMSIDKQIQVIDSFRFMISDEKHRPTLLNLLIDPTSMLNTLMDGYNETTGLFGPSVTETSLDYSESVYRVLSELGELGRVFDNDNGTRRLQALYSAIENHLNIAEKSVESLDAAISKILAALRISGYVPCEFSSYHTEYIPAKDGSTFQRQKVSDYSLQEPKRETIHNQMPTSDLVMNLVLISSLVGIGIISSFLKGKWFLLLVTLLMVFMFLVQVFMSVVQITNAVPEFLSRVSPQSDEDIPLDMGLANMMWTSRVEIESGGFSGEHDQDTEGSISPDSEAATASGQIPITGTQGVQGVVGIAIPEFPILTSISGAGFGPIIGTDLSMYLDSVLGEIEHIQYESQLEVMEAYPEIEPGETLEPDRIAEILKTSSDKILEAQKLMPDNPEVHHLLGRAYFIAFSASNANEHFKRAVELQPDNATLLKDYGEFLNACGLYKKAEAVLRLAVEADPFDHLPLVHLAESIIEQVKEDKGPAERVDEATKLLNDSLSRYPGEGKTWLLWGMISLMHKDWESVEMNMKACMMCDYDDPPGLHVHVCC
ncbi:MAG: hypothetical protein GF309_06205 [Candidatus Lokiarchaeota archaeon]|nr:hypothetical protein [Candidatus Lokiarchaeota archaeon]